MSITNSSDVSVFDGNIVNSNLGNFSGVTGAVVVTNSHRTKIHGIGTSKNSSVGSSNPSVGIYIDASSTSSQVYGNTLSGQTGAPYQVLDPTTALTSVGAIVLTATPQNSITLGRNDGFIKELNLFEINGGNNYGLRFNGLSRGNYYTAITANGLEALTVSQQGLVTANNFTQTSDSRLKTHLQSISPDEAAKKILQLSAYRYDWKDKARGSRTQVGVIAQEVEKVFPELVETKSDGFKSVAYANLVAPTIAAIKKIWQRQDDIDAKFEQLKVENEELKQRLKVLEEAQRRPASQDSH